MARGAARRRRFRVALRLFRDAQGIQSFPFAVTVHRYEEQIAGRTFHIEVSPVSSTRWRAQIARRPGMSTSLMPFYGQTPEEAAGELSRWLSLMWAGAATAVAATTKT